MSRPILPWKHQNTKIKDGMSLQSRDLTKQPLIDRALVVKSKDLPPVKYQLLDRDGQQVLVSLSPAVALNYPDYDLAGWQNEDSDGGQLFASTRVIIP